MATSPDGLQPPLDEIDSAILSQLYDVCEQVDPVPPYLADWLTARIAMDDMDIQICRLIEENLLPVRAAENDAMTITFQSTDLTIMLRIETRGDGSLRLDGWLAPAGVSDVELRGDAETWQTRTDGNGRFALDGVTPGVARLIVRPESGSPAAMTQSVVL